MDKKTVDGLTIHKIVAGSHLYGLATPESDVDWRGVCLAPEDCITGLGSFEQYQGSKDEDICIYELRRFCHLALKANPNILDILFAPPDTWEVKSGAWQAIYDARHRFLSQKIRHTFSGYAVSQLKRIKGHRKWLTDPPDHQPAQEEFGGEPYQGSYIFPDINAEKSYKAALKIWNQYQTWLKSRNPKRAKLECEFGYDTKHASHLVRLMIQAERILSELDYNPTLTGIDLDIVTVVKRGQWEYDYLIEWAEEMDNKIHNMPTALPHKPDSNLIERHVMDIYRNYLEDQWHS